MKPEVIAAKNKFQDLTNIKVLSAKKNTGSMRGYVTLTVDYPYEKLYKQFYTDKTGHDLNGVEIEFIGSDYKHPERSKLDIRWSVLS